MSKQIKFILDAEKEFKSITKTDLKTLKKIYELIEDIQINEYQGIGHPEPLKGNLSGYFSRKINEKNRLIYKIEDDSIIIIKCLGHYFNK